MALRAYFDESGTHWGGPQACDVFVLCGYIAPESTWDDQTNTGFAAKWRQALNGKPYFHATELEGRSYGHSIMLAAANLVIKSGLIGIGGGLSVGAYKRLMLPFIQQEKITDDPYLFMFTDVIVEAIEKSRMFLGEDPDEPISFVFENHPRWSITAHELYLKLQKDEDWPNRCRLGAVAFEDKKKFIPLQAADHIAFETYHYMNDNPPTVRPIMNRFLDWPQNHGRYYNERGLLSLIEQCKKDGKF